MWNLLLPIALALGGTYLSTQANSTAAQNAQNTQNAIAAHAQARAAPGQAYLRNVVANAGDLTPAQQQQLQNQRQSINNTIRSSPFAGSGQTAAALFKKADTDFTTTSLDQNRRDAIAASNTLAGSQSTADKATLESSLTGANAGTANASLYGKALGDIGSVISAQNKQSSYADRMSAIEKSLGLSNNG